MALALLVVVGPAAAQVAASPPAGASPAAQSEPGPTQRQAELWADQEIAGVVRSGGATAAGAVVVSGGQVLLARSYGWFDPVKQIPISPHDQFMIGSISKTFTSLVIAKLQEDGRIHSLDDSANLYLRRYRLPLAFGREVTIAQLATHTAGLDSPSFGLSTGDQTDIPAAGDYLRRKIVSIVRPPGFKAVYANFGPPVLGAVAEDITGERFDRLMAEQVFEPVGMRETVLGYDRSGGPHLVYAGINGSDGVRYAERLFNDPMTAPAGSVQTTPADMALFMNALLGHAPAVLSHALLEEQRKPRAVNYPGLSPIGLGVFLDPWNETTLVGHGGLVAGFRSNMEVIPERDVGVFVVFAGGKDLFNGGPGNAGTATDAFIKSVLGPAVPRSPRRSTDVHSLEGRYWMELRAHTTPEAMYDANRMVEVIAANDDLLIGTIGGPKERYSEIAPGLFQGRAKEGNRPALYGFEGGLMLANKMFATRVMGLSDPSRLIRIGLVALAIGLTGVLAIFTRGVGWKLRLIAAAAAAALFFALVWPVMRGISVDVELIGGHDGRFRIAGAVMWVAMAAALGCLFQAVQTLRRLPVEGRSWLGAAHCGVIGLAGLLLALIARIFHLI
jgi:CubicO group peptidase (beta-lactamase class C family)